jgi:diguanylate cyclase
MIAGLELAIALYQGDWRLGVAFEADKDRSQALATQAMAWLAQHGLPPAPDNFEIAFAYIAAENPELKRTVDELIAKNCTLDSKIMGILRQRYFRGGRHEDAIADLGAKISGELDSVLKSLEAATHDQSAYGRTLSKASGELGGHLSSNALKSMIDQVVAATRTMEARSKTLELQLQNSSREVGELRQRLETVRRESLLDPLTGIANRKAFDTELKASVGRSVETGEPVTLVMCDIDHFKTFNDTWGHQTGDQVLRLVANCLSENVKGRDTAARYGGEEFAVILPQTSLADAVGLADQIRGKVESKKLVKKSTGDILGMITISMGVAQYDPKESLDEFVARADTCLYAAKHAGRNRVVCEADRAVIDAAGAQAA